MRNIRYKASALAVACSLAVGSSGCATIGAVQTGAPITATDVQNDAVAACGFLPSAETASNLIQAATQTAGSGTASTDAAYTALAEQLAQLACAVAKGSAATTTPVPATTSSTSAKALRALKRKVGSVLISPGVAYIGSPPVAVQVTGSFAR